MKFKINEYNSFVILIAIYSVSVLTYKLMEPYFSVSKLLGTIIAFNVLWIYIRHLNSRDAKIIAFIAVLSMISIIISYNKARNFRDMIYWDVTILALWKLTRKDIVEEIESAIYRNNKIIISCIFLCNIAITLGFFSHQGYIQNWGGNYFVGFAASNHVLTCGCCLNLVLTLFFVPNIKNIIIKFMTILPSVFAILQSGARSYLISLIVILYIFYKNNFSKLRIKYIVIPIAVALVLLLFVNSGIMNKFINPYGGIDKIDAKSMTSGRSEFWNIDIHAYNEYNLFNKFFGKGFDAPYIINKERYHYEIWAHNDFINTILSVGAFGLLLYMYMMAKFSRMLFKNRDKIGAIMCVLYFLFVAFVNGLFAYQHYLYSFILLFVYFITDKNQKARRNLIYE